MGLQGGEQRSEADTSPEMAHIIRGKSYSFDFAVVGLVIVLALGKGLNVVRSAVCF